VEFKGGKREEGKQMVSMPNLMCDRDMHRSITSGTTRVLKHCL